MDPEELAIMLGQKMRTTPRHTPTWASPGSLNWGMKGAHKMRQSLFDATNQYSSAEKKRALTDYRALADATSKPSREVYLNEKMNLKGRVVLKRWMRECANALQGRRSLFERNRAWTGAPQHALSSHSDYTATWETYCTAVATNSSLDDESMRRVHWLLKDVSTHYAQWGADAVMLKDVPDAMPASARRVETAAEPEITWTLIQGPPGVEKKLWDDARKADPRIANRCTDAPQGLSWANQEALRVFAKMEKKLGPPALLRPELAGMAMWADVPDPDAPGGTWSSVEVHDALWVHNEVIEHVDFMRYAAVVEGDAAKEALAVTDVAGVERRSDGTCVVSTTCHVYNRHRAVLKVMGGIVEDPKGSLWDRAALHSRSALMAEGKRA